MLVARSMRVLQDLRHGVRTFARNPALTMVGLYGLVSYSVIRRTRETEALRCD
jgi:hypothetical protein